MELKPCDLHIWRLPFIAHSSVISQLRQYLSTADQQQADKIPLETVKQHFIFYRAAMRHVLSQYLSTTPPSAISFIYSTTKKPLLNLSPPLYFNLSHSHDLGVLAVGYFSELGIDIERLRTAFNAALAKRYFTAEEYAHCKAAAPHLQAQVFTRYWTKKEAIIKAAGRGIANHLNAFNVHEEKAILFEKRYWQTASLNIAPEYITTIAYTNAPADIQFFDYSSIFISG